MVQQNQFEVLSHKDPNIHLAIFLEICDTVKMNGISDDVIHLRFFFHSPFGTVHTDGYHPYNPKVFLHGRKWHKSFSLNSSYC